MGTSGLAHEPRCTGYLFTSNPHCLQVKPLEDVGYQPFKVQSVPVPSAKLHPDDPFLDAGFIGPMFHTLTIASMITSQSAVEELWP